MKKLALGAVMVITTFPEACYIGEHFKLSLWQLATVVTVILIQMLIGVHLIAKYGSR